MPGVRHEAVQCEFRDDAVDFAAEGLPDGTLVVFVDAYDVMILSPFLDIKARFIELASPILFGAEVRADSH